MVRQALADVTAVGGWELLMVGGGRRRRAVHDLDVLATHPTAPVEGVARRLYERIVALRRMVPKELAFCRLQVRAGCGRWRVGATGLPVMQRHSAVLCCAVTVPEVELRLHTIFVAQPAVHAVIWCGTQP